MPPFARHARLGAVGLLLLAVVGFWPTYIGKPFAPVDAHTHLHAALGLAWMLLLIAQPTWLLLQRRDLHRAVGRLGWFVALAFIVSGVLLAHLRFSRMDGETFERDVHWLYLPFYANTAFAASLALGWAFRHQRAVHGRFMLCTGAMLIDPAMARLLGTRLPPLPWEPLYQIIGFGLTDLALLAILLARPLPAQARSAAWALIGLVLSLHAGWFAFAPTPAWRAIGAWFRALPLN